MKRRSLVVVFTGLLLTSSFARAQGGFVMPVHRPVFTAGPAQLQRLECAFNLLQVTDMEPTIQLNLPVYSHHQRFQLPLLAHCFNMDVEPEFKTKAAFLNRFALTRDLRSRLAATGEP